MVNEIKLRLMQLDKKQVDLLAELRRRGYTNMCQPTLSKYIRGHEVTPQARAVRELSYQILDEWESEEKSNRGIGQNAV